VCKHDDPLIALADLLCKLEADQGAFSGRDPIIAKLHIDRDNQGQGWHLEKLLELYARAEGVHLDVEYVSEES